jgi:hypothetical protein
MLMHTLQPPRTQVLLLDFEDDVASCPGSSNAVGVANSLLEWGATGESRKTRRCTNDTREGADIVIVALVLSAGDKTCLDGEDNLIVLSHGSKLRNGYFDVEGVDCAGSELDL